LDVYGEYLSTAREALLCDLFAELTGAAKVGRDDNFFHLGGSSFGAIKLIARINKSFACNLTIRTFFEQPTIRQLADAILRTEQERCLNKAAPLILEKAAKPHAVDWRGRENNALSPLSIRGAAFIYKRGYKRGSLYLPVVFLFPGIGGDSPQLAGFRNSLSGCVHLAVASLLKRRSDFFDPTIVAFLGLIDTPLGRVMRRSRIIPWKAISRYIQTLRSKRSIQDVLAVIYESFVSGL
jgi:hypothetical protein